MDLTIINILKEICNNGYEAYIVGGYVRDNLLRKKSFDVDICTNARPKDLLKIFGSSVTLVEEYGAVKLTKGKYNIAVCLGTACFVKGSEKVLDRVKQKLGIDVGQTTKDGKFSIEATRCIGACGLAPVFTVNDEVYGKATPELVDKVIDEYMSKE